MYRTLASLALVLTVALGNLQAELVHYYSFDTQTAGDSVGGLDGTIQGDPTFGPGQTGAAGDFAIYLNEEGPGFQDDYVEFEPTEFGDAFTIAAWIKPVDEDQTSQMMGIAANTHGGFAGPDGFKWAVNQWNNRDGSLRLETGDTITGTNSGAAGVIFLEDEEWQHVAIAFDKEVLQYEMFADGISVGTGGILEFGDDLPWVIGNFVQSLNAGFLGAVDSFAVFDEALLENEIFDIFENGIDVSEGLTGDFNFDGLLTDLDIDLLSDEVLAGTNNLGFDVNNDTAVNQADREVWVNDLKMTYFGDSNLDGEFNSTDFVAVFQAGEYEDGVAGNSTWATGDWNGDKEFDSSDFVVAFQGGGFETGPQQATGAATGAVPEPLHVLPLWWIASALVVLQCRANRKPDAHRCLHSL